MRGRGIGARLGSWAAAPPSSLPAWIAALDVGEWVEVPTSNAIGDVAYGSSPGGTVQNVVNAWGGIAASPDGDVYLFGGGHGDYAGNEIYRLRLNAASPSWARLNDPTATVRTNENYYADGNPTARHTYNALCARGTELVCVGGGGLWGSGSVDPGFTDVFDLVELTWSTSVASGGNWWACVNHDTGDIYSVGPNAGFFRFRHLATDNTLTILGNGVIDPYSAFGAVAFDSARNRVWIIGNTDNVDAQYWTVGTGGANPTLSGAEVAEFDNGGAYAGIDYDIANDCILKADGTGGTVYKLDCDTFECTAYSTTGTVTDNATNGVNGRFKYVPDLGGFIYIPSWGNAWFLKTAAL